MTTYLPFEERVPDPQYGNLLRMIHDHGVYGPTRQNSPAKTVLGKTINYYFANGFPCIPDRSIKTFWPKAIDELGAFIGGAHSIDSLRAVGLGSWWEAWATEAKTSKRGLPPGEMGPGFYGSAFHDYPGLNGQPYDQFAALIEDIKLNPYDRRHHINPWIPYHVLRSAENPDSNVTIAPCHGWITITILEDGLHLEMMQRSGDYPVGVPSNMIQYAALAIYIGHLVGFPAVEYIHHFMNAHVYEKQESTGLVWQMLNREPLRLPTLQLNDAGLAATDIHQFSSRLFELTDYHPHPGIPGIPVLT
jgi:thymidylate synthase